MDFNEIFNSVKSLDELRSVKAKIDESFNERENVLVLLEKARSLADKPLWFIKESFENLTPELFKMNEGKNLIKSYIATIKGDNDFQKIYSLYESVRKSGKDTDIDFFVNETVNYNWNIDDNKLNEVKNELGSLLSRAYLLIGEEADKLLPTENNEKLDGAISYIIENRKSHRNISEYGSAVKIIKEFIDKNEVASSIFEKVNIDDKASKMLDEFNEKYGDVDEEDATLIREMAESNDKEALFNKYKKNCIRKIEEQRKAFDEKGDSESSERLANIREKLEGKKFSKETLEEDIVNIVNMTKVL